MFFNYFTIFVIEYLFGNYVSTEMDVENLLINHMKNISYRVSVRPSIVSPTGAKGGHQATEVKVRIFINEIGSISVTNNDFTVGVTLNQMWVDQRLVLNETFEFLALTYLKPRIWTPDLYFLNTKTVLDKHKLGALLWLYPNGSILYSTTMRLNLYCHIILWRFPLDTQNCRIELGSYGYPTEDLKVKWWYDVREKRENVELKDVCNTEYQEPSFEIQQNHSRTLQNGLFSVLTVNFIFRRNFIYHIIYTFLPSSLIVSVSWVSFCIDHRSVPARIPFCLLTLIALMTQLASINSTMPRLPYVKCVDIWMFICMAFVILSLLEYAVVNQLATKRELKDKNKVKKRELNSMALNEIKRSISHDSPFSSNFYKNSFFSNQESSPNSERIRKKFELSNIPLPVVQDQAPRKPGIQPNDIDKLSLLVFPCLFFITNILFWCVFLFYE